MNVAAEVDADLGLDVDVNSVVDVEGRTKKPRERTENHAQIKGRCRKDSTPS